MPIIILKIPRGDEVACTRRQALKEVSTDHLYKRSNNQSGDKKFLRIKQQKKLLCEDLAHLKQAEGKSIKLQCVCMSGNIVMG